MGRAANDRQVNILHIGPVDPNHGGLWQQLPREGFAIAFAPTQQAGIALATKLQPQIAVINTTGAHFSGERLAVALGRRLPSTLRLLIAETSVIPDAPCELRLNRPFTLHKLREAIIKLLEKAAPVLLQTGPLQLNQVSRTLTGPKGEHSLTPKQCSLLMLLMRHPNQVLSRKELMEQIWGTAYLGDTRTLDVHIRWLREKIEPEPTRPVWLITKRNVGYVLSIPELVTTPEDLSDADDSD